MYPTKQACTSETIASAPIISLNGADNVTLDGRGIKRGQQKFEYRQHK
jgi:hypothetical protein